MNTNHFPRSARKVNGVTARTLVADKGRHQWHNDHCYRADPLHHIVISTWCRSALLFLLSICSYIEQFLHFIELHTMYSFWLWWWRSLCTAELHKFSIGFGHEYVCLSCWWSSLETLVSSWHSFSSLFIPFIDSLSNQFSSLQRAFKTNRSHSMALRLNIRFSTRFLVVMEMRAIETCSWWSSA